MHGYPHTSKLAKCRKTHGGCRRCRVIATARVAPQVHLAQRQSQGSRVSESFRYLPEPELFHIPHHIWLIHMEPNAGEFMCFSFYFRHIRVAFLWLVFFSLFCVVLFLFCVFFLNPPHYFLQCQVFVAVFTCCVFCNFLFS